MDHRLIPAWNRQEHNRRRAGARVRGEVNFYGLPCHRCAAAGRPQDGLRRSRNGQCVHCRRYRATAQKRLWRARNPEKARAELLRHLIKLGDRRVGSMPK